MFNFIGCNSDMQKMLHELSKQLRFTQCEDGLAVRLEPIESGLAVLKEGNAAVLQYSSLNTLCRAVYLLAANQERDALEIRQTCAFQGLEIMLDLSRNAVLTVETVKDMVRHLACMGYTAVLLYTEDTLEVTDEPYFGYMRGRLTAEEIQEIDAYCQLFGIELVPCIQTLAHMNQITRYACYDPIIDVNDILLAGEERTYGFLENIFKTVAQNFSSRRINIGMDEAHMLGLGKYLDKHGYHSRFEIMAEHLNKVQALCRKYGFQPQMWSDMFFRLIFNGDYYVKDAALPQELADKIPKDIQLIYWDYYSTDYEHYNRILKNHLTISPNVGFAGGAWKWTGFAPDNAFSLKTGENALKACKDNGIRNFMVTCWGDNGAEASVYSILPALYFYAQSAYSSFFEKEPFAALTGVDFDTFMALDLPNRVTNSECERNNAGKFFLYNDLLMGTFDSLVPDGIGTLYAGYAERLKRAGETSEKYGYLFEPLQKLCEVLAVKADLGVRLKKAYDAKDIETINVLVRQEFPRLTALLKEFYNAFSAQWHRENKSFGFEVQCIRLGGLISRVEYARERLELYAAHRLDKILELEQERKPFAYFDDLDPDRLIYNLWSVIVSPSVV